MAHTPELEKLERRYDDDPAKWFAQLAEAYRKYERIDDALAILNNHLQDRPNYVSALIVLGRCHLDQKNDPEARGAFERVLAIDPENIIALKVLGEVAERAGDLDGARDWLTRLLDVDPANDDAREALDRLGGAATTAAAAPEPAPSAPQVSFGDLAADVEGDAAVSGFEPTSVESAAVAEPAPAPEPEPAAAPVAMEPAAPAAPDEEPGVVELDAPAPAAALPEPAAAAHDPEDLPLERASVEVTAPTVEMEPIELEAAPAEALPEPAAEVPVEIGDVELEPFDDSLQWGTGERRSREVSAADVAAAQEAHEDSLEVSAVEELPGLAGADVPDPESAHDVAAVEGLLDTEAPKDLEPAPGFEPTSVEFEAAAGGGGGDATLEMPGLVSGMEPPPAEAEAALSAAPTAEVPFEPEPEPEPELEPEPEAEAPIEAIPASTRGVGDRGSLAGLPVILPEEETAAAEPASEEEDAGDGEVVTETMAELYVQQGLIEEARAVYRRLLAVTPEDARLAARLRELEAPPRPAAARARASARYAAAETGGPSARDFLQSILDGQAVELPPPPAAPPPMELAAASEPLEPRGLPTRPASSTYTLGQVFGEETPPKPEPGAAEASGAGSGFSFDEFFSGGQKPAPRPSTGGTRPDDGDDDSFREWLKGLKK